MEPERSDPCKCGSGKEFEHCCGKAESAPQEPSPDEINSLVALFNTGCYAELEGRARLQVDQYPNFGFGWKLLGGSLQMQGKDALYAFQRAAELLPGDAEAHYNLGVVQKNIRQLDDAAASYRRALEIKPDFAEAHGNLGNVLKDLGQYQSALQSYRRAVELKPGSAVAHYNVGIVLNSLGQFDGAVSSYSRALEIKPDFAEVYINLGAILQNQNRLAEAESNYRRALEIKPGFAEAHFKLGGILQDQNRLAEAEASYRRTLELRPNYTDAHYNLGLVLQTLGQLDGAIESYRMALEIKPDFAEAYDNLLFCLSNSETVDAETLFSEHRRFGEQFEAPMRANWPRHTNSRDPERVLQIGFVSADFNNHAVASFIGPVLDNLSSYPQLSLHAFYNHTIDDAVTRRLRGYLPHWHSIADLSDDALAQVIQKERIDILIDLSGHTGKNRLLTFARKPAPIQVSWMGYPGTTGLRAIDYYVADRFLLPPGQFDEQFTEKIVRLPANAPFLLSADAPPVNALPALSNGYMTFGSFNRLSKISRSVIALWSQLLRALPDSRMSLGDMPEDDRRGTLIEWFAQEGIARERLDFHVRSGMKRYLSLHHQVDICLDTFPYNGGTTTLYALCMGVPTLTLAGHSAPNRQGVSILGHVGLEVFAAHNAADFVQQGLSWPGNLAELSDIRAGLRERFAQSAMGQPLMVAAGLDRALRTMWRRWCAGLPPDVIDAYDN